MKDTDWQIIYELYKQQNITKVATKLFMTQPTLTKRLQLIEDEFQVRIVNRSTKGVQFTKEGEFLAHQAELYLQFLEGTRRRVEAFKEEEFGTIRIASSYTFGKYSLPDLIREFQKIHPHISFDVQNVKSHNLISLLTEGNSDMAFVRGEYECDLYKRKIMSEAAYLISREPITMENLFQVPRIECIMGEFSQKLLDRWWEEQFDEAPRISVTVRDVDTSWEMVRRGLGYTIGFFEKSLLDSLQVYSIPLFYGDGTPVERSTWLIYSERIAKAPFVQEFIDHVEELYEIPPRPLDHSILE